MNEHVKSYYDAVVYAEDDKNLNEMFTDYLSLLTNHPKIISCEDGREAFEQIQKLIQENIRQKILLISDGEMPYLNGIELSKKLRETYDRTNHQIDIVLFTGLNSDRVNKYIPQFIDYYIFKNSSYEQQDRFLTDLNSKGLSNLELSNYQLSDQYQPQYHQKPFPRKNNELSDEELLAQIEAEEQAGDTTEKVNSQDDLIPRKPEGMFQKLGRMFRRK